MCIRNSGLRDRFENVKRWDLSGYVLLSVISFVLLAGGAAGQSQCDAAVSLFNATLYDEALENYTAMLKQNPNLECAQAGIIAVKRAQAEEFYELGQAYENAGQREEAGKAYTSAIEKDTTFMKAQWALANVSGDPFAAVRILAGLGLYTEASEALKKAANEEPGKPVPDELKYLSGGTIPEWRQSKQWFETWGFTIGEILTALAIALLALYIVINRIFPWIYDLIKEFFLSNPHLEIQDFDKGSTELDIGKGLAAIVEASINHFSNEGNRALVHIVEGPIQKLEIPDVKAVTENLKFIFQLFELAFPRNVITLSGYLQKSEDRGAGLSLILVKRRTGEIVDSMTIWQKDFEMLMVPSDSKDPTQYHQLAELVAIWIIFRLLAYREHQKNSVPKKWIYELMPVLAPKEEPFNPLGTDRWESYAYFRVAVQWSLKGEKDKARHVYIEALNQDMRNCLPWFNLGVLDIEAGEYDRALKRLEQVKQNTKPNGILWYKALYQLAAVYEYKGDWTNAAKEAKKLVEAATKAAAEPANAKDVVLMDFMKSFKPIAISMYAGVLVGQDNILEAEKQDKISEVKKQLKMITPMECTYRVRYNLACYYSIMGKREKDAEKAKLSYQKALLHLNSALERGGTIVQWAQNDPSLEGVREDKNMKNDFIKLINKYGQEIPESSNSQPLAGLAIIREAYAKRLKEQGILSPSDLIVKADTPQAQEVLAKNLGINTALLLRWAFLAELMRIVEEANLVNLLEAAKVDSIDALKNVNDPFELEKLLNQVNLAYSFVKKTPSAETIQRWVNEAKKAKPHVT